MTVAANTTGPLLEVRDLRTSYPTSDGTISPVDTVSLSLDAGATLGIVGESGSGKSVLSRSIMGLERLKGATVTGSVVYGGRELLELGRKDLRSLWGSEIAMVFQDAMATLNPVLRVGRQIEESLRFHRGLSRSEARERGAELLAAVGISDPERRMDQYSSELSGGLRQRVVIAITLAGEPELLFADEPTTALDATVQVQVLRLLEEQQHVRSMAMILVSHDLAVVAATCDTVAVMYAGQIVEYASSADLLTTVRMPYTEGLLLSMPQTSRERHSRLRAIRSAPPQAPSSDESCRFAPRCPYATEICFREMPPLIPSTDNPSHLVRCWHPVDVPIESIVALPEQIPEPEPQP